MKSILLALAFCGSMALADAPVAVSIVATPAAISVAQPPVIVAAAPSDVAAPPAWLVQAMKTVEGVPVIGKIAVEVFKWAGVLGVIMTALVACLLTIAKALQAAGGFAKLAAVVAWASSFESGKIMYWLKFFSFYNAKKE